MGTPTIGDVVLIAFPYADFSAVKVRPALIVARAELGNLIVSQITSNAKISKSAILLSSIDFDQGGLNIDSFVRPDKLFTVELSVIQKTLGKLKPSKLKSIHKSIKELFRADA